MKVMDRPAKLQKKGNKKRDKSIAFAAVCSGHAGVLEVLINAKADVGGIHIPANCTADVSQLLLEAKCDPEFEER
jgi:hypothetical protein